MLLTLTDPSELPLQFALSAESVIEKFVGTRSSDVSEAKQPFESVTETIKVPAHLLEIESSVSLTEVFHTYL